jgi:hypothetical protein
MTEVKFREIKNEIRILGIDDAPFKKDLSEKTALIGVVFRGGSYLEGVLKSEIIVDGDDVTDKIIDMIRTTRHQGHLRILMLSGITFGGLNIANIHRLYEKTGLPIIIVTRKLPDLSAMKKAIFRVPHPEDKIKRLLSAGDLHEIELNTRSVIIQKIGLSLKDAIEIIKLSTIRGLIPEPIRVAHIIASGITTGESRGRA